MNRLVLGSKGQSSGHCMTNKQKIPFSAFVSAISPVCIDGFS